MSDTRTPSGAAPGAPATSPVVPPVRSLALRTDLAVLALGGSEIDDRGTHLVVRTPDNPDYWWGTFLALRELPAPGGEREVIGAFHTEHPEVSHVAIALDGAEAHDPERLAAFVEAGLTVCVDTVLAADRLVAPVHPVEDAEVRPLVGDDWERRVELELTVSDGPPESTRPFAERRAATERAICERGDAVRMGAFVDGELVSTAACVRTDAMTGRFQLVETHPDHRRRGLAAAVVHAAGTAALSELGVGALVIVADPAGPAIGTYRRLGFADLEVSTTLESAPVR